MQVVDAVGFLHGLHLRLQARELSLQARDLLGGNRLLATRFLFPRVDELSFGGGRQDCLGEGGSIVALPGRQLGCLHLPHRCHAPEDIEGSCRSEEHTSELQSLMRSSYAVFCLKKKKQRKRSHTFQTVN